MTYPTNSDDLDSIAHSSSEALRMAREVLAGIEKSREEQPALLAAARNAADAAREATIAEQPWAENLQFALTETLTGEVNGVASFPGIEAKEIWGSRLLFDLIGCTDNDGEINDVLSRYFTLLNGDTAHLFIVMSAALVTCADTLIPMLLDDIEKYGNNYGARVYLADAARKSWELNINALRQTPNYEADGDE
ncbi:hypothetical protein [Mycolicibacterium vanbaalenii]|uniref:Uncharacterized protein n=1 Tax=Mycolicibacterium vanbaalenii (strain DSM 7251 / JCM 13017 / BCRC 16820 / KCTC 9966 / NRRL B-24157 / PYR-1) TaxID=350058 RepID=A1T534_MYCVP|nr:hypothetical protein [Mycolicibacterium vanbaalenii]ABM12284.1 hypothetical protein Mvan_1451 [Mycolicibacterium vanbaalenii PYR-1]MCV7131015.1 hypothetical protein [Mycolicibacterium vanbaalenii PYR-1]